MLFEICRLNREVTKWSAGEFSFMSEEDVILTTSGLSAIMKKVGQIKIPGHTHSAVLLRVERAG